jgi:hypothetical protein
VVEETLPVSKKSSIAAITIHGGSGMKRGLLLICAGGISLGLTTAGFAKTKGPEWCCMVGGEMAAAVGQGAKKMCVKSEEEPTATSKSPLAKKYSKACTVLKGTWQKGGTTAAAEPAGTPMEKAKGAAKGKVMNKLEEKAGGDMKDMLENATEE